LCHDFIIFPLSHIINFALTSSVFPDAWKQAKVIPRTKTVYEFRPISILPFLSKLLEKVMQQQISRFLHSKNLIHPLQSGFRRDHSCTTALLKITNDISKAIDKDEITIYVSLDFSKAFDMVNHNLLCNKLINNFDFSAQAANLIYSYLTNRYQTVFSNNFYSDLLLITCGIPQGSILGPLLFSIFINDIFRSISYSNLHLFADDASMFLSRPLGLVEDCIFRINEDLANIHNWSSDNKLLLNPNKTKCLYIYRNELDTDNFSPVIINNQIISVVKSIKSLGFHFSSDFTCDLHVNSSIRKVYAGLRSLRVTRYFVPTKTKIILSKLLLIPQLTYGCELFGQLDSENAYKINLAFNSIIRYIYKLRRYDHVSAYSSSLLGCDILKYFDYTLIIVVCAY